MCSCRYSCLTLVKLIFFNFLFCFSTCQFYSLSGSKFLVNFLKIYLMLQSHRPSGLVFKWSVLCPIDLAMHWLAKCHCFHQIYIKFNKMSYFKRLPCFSHYLHIYIKFEHFKTLKYNVIAFFFRKVMVVDFKNITY